MSVQQTQKPGGSGASGNGRNGNGQRPPSEQQPGLIVRVNRAIYRQAPEVIDSIKLLPYNLYKSIYRTTALPKTERERSEAFFNSFLLHIQPAKIEKHALRFTYTFGLGLLSFYLFLILTITGILLMFFYVPSTEQAYNRMLDLRSAVSFGMIMRGMHFWAANAMIGVVFFHMCRVFYTGAYKPPREFNWVIGVILFVLTLVLGFTGYLLPWDQLAFWAITVGANIAGKADWISDHIAMIPYLSAAKDLHFGGIAKNMLLGGDTVGQEALLRFYTLHVIVLPSIMGAAIVGHFWRIRKDGGISSPKESPE
ncbi:MAG TPA: cytochrome b N-terminal domain-containing protein [Capsulimonadaceae bacterium]|nr:cytochrome b N-terminal domain-containing protein [Capsulimonadaceae bacterium]